jgi:hypothetical protein
MKRIAVWIVVAIIVWAGYETYMAGKNEVSPPGPQPILMNYGKAHGERLSTPSWSIEYDNVVGNTDQTILNLQGIHNGIFYHNSRPYLRIRADHMTVNTITHDFTASGPFHIETVDHAHFRSLDTTAATWNDATKRLFLPQKTLIKTNSRTKSLTADTITVEVEKKSLHMENIRGSVLP